VVGVAEGATSRLAVDWIAVIDVGAEEGDEAVA
jgi:hypothetical protein